MRTQVAMAEAEAQAYAEAGSGVSRGRRSKISSVKQKTNEQTPGDINPDSIDNKSKLNPHTNEWIGNNPTNTSVNTSPGNDTNVNASPVNIPPGNQVNNSPNNNTFPIPPGNVINNSSSEVQPNPTMLASDASSLAILQLLQQEQQQQRQLIGAIQLPKVELMKFDGDPVKYWRFIRAFDNSVTNDIDDNSKLTRLLQYCISKGWKGDRSMCNDASQPRL